MSPFFLTLVQMIMVLFLAPFVIGLTRTCKARLQGRHGASPFLPYITFATLLKKQMVISSTASWIFRVSPFVVFGSSIFLAGVLPLISTGSAFAMLSDFVLVGAVLAIGAIFLVLGGLDPGSAFGGMGASREMTIAAMLEPGAVMTFAAFAVVTGAHTVDGMVSTGRSLIALPLFFLPILALILIALAENARYPVDNPATHLELTMVHEAMVLEYSGPYLAMLEYASSLKLTIFLLLIANMIFPIGVLNQESGTVAVFFAAGGTVAKLMVGAACIALLESSIAKMRVYRMQEYLSLAFFIALAGMVAALVFSPV